MAINDAPDWQRQVMVNSDITGVPLRGALFVASPIRLMLYADTEYEEGFSLFTEEVPPNEQWTIQSAQIFNFHGTSGLLGLGIWYNDAPYRFLSGINFAAKEPLRLNTDVILCEGEKFMGVSLTHGIEERIELLIIGYKQNV